MKKTLLVLVSLLMTMGAFADEATFDFTGESAYGMNLLSGTTSEYNPDPYTCTEGQVSLTLNGKTRWWKGSKGNELRFYKGSSMNVAAPKGEVVTSIVFETKAGKSFESAVGTYNNGTWTGALNSVDITCNISEKNAAISKITVTYQKSDAPVKKNPELAFSETEATATLGVAFTAPTLTKATTADVVFTSSNEAVATVDAVSGYVNVLAEGQTEITASAPENDEYSAGSAKYTLKVVKPALEEVTEPYTETFESNLGSFTIDNVSLGEGLTYVWKIDENYKCAKASAYIQKNVASESWLVSPWINISHAEVIRNLYFDHAVSKYFGDKETEATVWIKVKDGDWTQLTGVNYPAIPDGKSFSPFETQTISLAGYEGKTVKIGFKYVSSDKAAGTWEIRNFIVATSPEASIKDVTADKFDANAPIFNLAGQRVSKDAKGILIQNGKKFVVK